MIKPIARQLAVLAGLSIWLGGCSSGQGPFRIVQLCLAGQQEIPVFTGFMDEIAQSYQMEFTDRSGQAEAELRSIDNPNVSVPRPLVNIGADRAGEFSFGAGNLGLPTQQMAIGFNGKKSTRRSVSPTMLSRSCRQNGMSTKCPKVEALSH
jgi:hypothetical protein